MHTELIQKMQFKPVEWCEQNNYFRSVCKFTGDYNQG